ncbi:SH3 domain-containing protein, partial [Circinella umbellata]
ICKAQALYPFQSKEPTALNFEPGILIDVLSKVDSGWWLGCTPGSAPGWFPKDYVEGYNENGESTLPPIQLNRKSFTTTNNNSNYSKSKNKKSNEWITQSTEDGEGQYLFNPITGEMRFTFPEDDEDNNE